MIWYQEVAAAWRDPGDGGVGVFRITVILTL